MWGGGKPLLVGERTGNKLLDCKRLRHFATHTWENKMAEGSSEKMSSETTEDEPFETVPVRRKRKRGQLEDMDTSEELKRPSFPPAKAEKLMVSVNLLRRQLYDECKCSSTLHIA